MPPLNTEVETLQQQPSVSEMEVDYDKNITTLYSAITSCEWDTAVEAVKNNPKEAQTWVVRHYENEQNDQEPGEVMWRFLPIHSACARQPPASVISALIKAYPDGPKCADDQGMYPLHYACGNQASREVIRLLLVAFPQAAKMADPRGMLPIHYLACWGPSSVSIIDMMLVANRDVSEVKDADGNSALDLAMEGEYDDREAVVSTLRRWMEKSATRTGPPFSPRSPIAEKKHFFGLTVSTPTAADEPTIKASPEKEANNRSPRTISRLRHEMTKLKTELREAEEIKKDEIEQALAPVREQVKKLQGDLEASKRETESKEKELESVKADLAKYSLFKDQATALQLKEDILRSTEAKLADTMQNLMSAERDRDQLKEEVIRAKEERNALRLKSEHLNGRLGSLSASLASISETQLKVNSGVRDREARLASAAEVRRAKLQALVDFEAQLAAVDAATSHDADLMHQQRELDAIAAVIATMKV